METTIRMAFLLLVISAFLCSSAAVQAQHKETRRSVSNIFVLGDSGFDAGTNNYIENSKARADFAPYGITYFHRPTGRFSDGRTLADFLAKKLGLPFPKPFLDNKADFSKGINFASGGSGILNSTGSSLNVVPMSLQVSQFNEAIKGRAKTEISNSIAIIQVGSNDLAEYLQNTTIQNTNSPAQFISLLLSKYSYFLNDLCSQGVRKLVVGDIFPLGCTPLARLSENPSDDECVESVNRLTEAFNDGLLELVNNFNLQLKAKAKTNSRKSVVVMKSYPFFTDVIKNGKKYGFIETANACCGGGAFNAAVECGNKAKVCDHRQRYIFWDRVHRTDRFHSILSELMWAGNSSYIFPLNIYSLVYGK